MEKILADLFAKRGSAREAALSSIIGGFKLNYKSTFAERSEFAERNFATLLYRCLHSIKKGSSDEIALACRALGLLSITVGYGDHAEELHKELIPAISPALKSKNDSVLLSVINCLAVATFVGASDFEQIETSMQIIWRFVIKQHSHRVVSAAVSAWSLLLTTINAWNLDHHYWRGAVPCFLDLIKVEDEYVCMAACEAIALICEVGCLHKFSSNPTIDTISLDEKGRKIRELQEIVANHSTRLLLRGALLENPVVITEKGPSSTLEVLQSGSNFPDEASLKIGKHTLQLYSVSDLLQLNFIKRFLEREFVPQLMANEFLHDVFNFTPVEPMPVLGDGHHDIEREEVTVTIYVPESRQSEQVVKGWTHKPSKSAILKGTTKFLNKKRLQKESMVWSMASFNGQETSLAC